MQQAVILLMMQKESNLKPNFDNLSKTINTLGIELGNVIKQQAGTKNFNLVEEIRINSKKYRFDPHISLAYGQFDLEQIHRVTKGIAIPKYVVFSGLSIVNTQKDVEQWETVFQRKF